MAYANEAKTQLLGVPPELIEEHGAVSEPVALAMAEGIARTRRRGRGVGVTGIAGPGRRHGGKAGGNRRRRGGRRIGRRARASSGSSASASMVKFQASQAALDMVRRMLQGA